MSETRERLVLRAAQQRELDARAYASGIAQDALMESAGTNAAAWILERIRPKRAVILAGPGGNGGDALVVARRLHEEGTEVHPFALTASGTWSPATARMARRLSESGAPPIRPTTDPELVTRLEHADCAVDGLFGSGLRRPLGDDAKRLVRRVADVRARTISLDIPSGLASDTGDLPGEGMRADTTLAMAFLKPVHLLYPAAGHCGNTTVVDVAYPESVLADAGPWARVCERSGIRVRLPDRRPDGHKGTFGRVLVVAGSIGMTGAAILCCRGALSAGAGLVTLAVPDSLDPILETALPEAITVPLPAVEGHIASLDAARLRDALDVADVLAVGPGLSRAPEVLDAVRVLVEAFPGPIVLDADGLCALAEAPETLGRLAGRAVLTPHPGEFGGLVGASATEIDGARKDHACAFAREHRVVLVLKGRPTAIGLPDGRVYLNPTGNEGLATGGSGDVLTGLIAGLVAGGATLDDAAIVGTYVHGRAAELYARERSARSLTASALVDLVPRAVWEVEQCG